jgi:hypothetical protein
MGGAIAVRITVRGHEQRRHGFREVSRARGNVSPAYQIKDI